MPVMSQEVPTATDYSNKMILGFNLGLNLPQEATVLVNRP
jgi:hypothetical protein